MPLMSACHLKLLVVACQAIRIGLCVFLEGEAYAALGASTDTG